MDRDRINLVFNQLTATLEQEHDKQQELDMLDAFRNEPRPMPEGMIPDGIPLGHIALRGDFEQPTI